MREERLSILRMLEKGIITADEAEKLLLALSGSVNDKFDKDEITDNLNSALSRAGELLGSFAKSVGETAEKVAKSVGDKTTDAAKTMGEKAEEAAKDVEPILKKVAFTVADKAVTAAENVKNYAEKKMDEISQKDKDAVEFTPEDPDECRKEKTEGTDEINEGNNTSEDEEEK